MFQDNALLWRPCPHFAAWIRLFCESMRCVSSTLSPPATVEAASRELAAELVIVAHSAVAAAPVSSRCRDSVDGDGQLALGRCKCRACTPEKGILPLAHAASALAAAAGVWVERISSEIDEDYIRSWLRRENDLGTEGGPWKARQVGEQLRQQQATANLREQAQHAQVGEGLVSQLCSQLHSCWELLRFALTSYPAADDSTAEAVRRPARGDHLHN